MGNGKAELSRSVGAQYLRDNQICLLPSEIAGVWVQVPPLLFRRFIVLRHGGGTSVGEDRGGGRPIFLTGTLKGNPAGFPPPGRWQLPRSFQEPNFREAPNGSWLEEELLRVAARKMDTGGK